MLSLIGMPAAGRLLRQALHVHGGAERRRHADRLTLIWLVALGLFNSVVSAFYYVRVLKAMFLREPGRRGGSRRPTGSIAVPIVLARWSSSASASSRPAHRR